MSDLEQRLAEALTEGAQGAPPATGLAAAARSRAGAKRRTRLAGVAAVVALGVGVPAAVAATHGSGGGDAGPGPADRQTAIDTAPTGGTGLPGGYHYESWHDVTVEVPDSWTYGAPGSWCAGGGELDPPRVGRPGDVSESIACSPTFGYGITFQTVQNKGDFEWPLTQQDPDSWPADAYVGARGLDGVLVQVALPDLALAQQILDSVQQNDVLDPNGCPISAGNDPAVPAGDMTVCRYGADNVLEQSELLHGADVSAAEQALSDAPDQDGDRRGPGPCPGSHLPSTTIKMASAATYAAVTIGDCVWDRGVRTDAGDQDLTPDVLYWALSPGWSGSVPRGVPLPSRLRTD